ncbi:MAG: sodium pump decarboxylase subunit gamma [Ruminococcaceae bacterium]|nr:sodium pump decarboxylase subunit gamma [Oscillospiraceae bacterium]
MNLALSILSDAAASNVIDEIQKFATAPEQVDHEAYWGSVGIITLTGILVVFIILAILIFFFWGMGVIFSAIDNSKKKKAVSEKPTPAPVEKVEPVVAEEEDISDDDEIIAVISAAIAAYSEQDGKSYEIRSIRRKDSRTRSAWNLAGIGDNTRPF